MKKILAGCRVIENGMFITGPYTAMLLADLGAEVIKVERPGTGDPFRSFEHGLYGPQFQAFNRNKKSIALDLHRDDDRATLHRLIADADVYIQNARPGVAERLGCGAEAMRALNPRLIYCAITGSGRDGPYADRPTYDTVAQARSGFLSMFVSPDAPHVVGPAISDSVTGLYAAYGILGALFARHATGKGSLVEVSMLEATMHFAIEQFQGYFTNGRVADPSDRGRVSQSMAFICSDGALLALHLSSPVKFWEGLLTAIERPDLGTDPRFAGRMDRVHHHQALVAALTPVFAGRPREEWLRRLEAADVPHAPILNVAEVMNDKQVRHAGIERYLVHPLEGTIRTLRSPVIFDGDRDGLPMMPPPVLDEHGPALRAAMGLAQSEPQGS